MAREIPFGCDIRAPFSRGKGDSAVAKAAYRAGMCPVDRRTGEVHDYTRKQHVVHTEIMAPEGAPAWGTDREELWNRVEAAEKHPRAQVAREVLLTLPRELTRDQQLEMVRKYVKAEFVDQGMVADVCIHAPNAEDGEEQPHAHILLTMRPFESTPTGFVKTKARGFDHLFVEEDAFKKAKSGKQAGKAFLSKTGGKEELIQHWEDLENSYLEAAGSDARVDHRSLDVRRAEALAQGDIEKAMLLARPPEPKLGRGRGMKRRGLQSDRAAEVQEIRENRRQILDLAEERAKRKPRIHPDDWRAETEMAAPDQQREMENRLEQHKRKFGTDADRPNRQDRHEDRRVDDAARSAGRNQQNRLGTSGAGRASTRPAGTARNDFRPAGQAARRPLSADAQKRKCERQKRVTDYRSGMDRVSVAERERRQEFKRQLLERWYRTDIERSVAEKLAWVRNRPNETVAQFQSGARVRDTGAEIAVQKVDVAALKLQMELGKARGWREIEVSGSKAYQLAAADAATRAGLVVTNADPRLQQVIDAAKLDMAGQPAPRMEPPPVVPIATAPPRPRTVDDDLMWVRRHLVAAKHRESDLTSAAQVQTWRGPDGRPRPFVARVDGIAGPVAVKVSQDEAKEIAEGRRAVLQAPEWARAQTNLEKAQGALQTAEDERAALGFWARNGGAGVRAADKIKEAKAAVKAAGREVERLNDVWEEAVLWHVTEIRREAEKLRQQALKDRDEAKVLAQAEAGAAARLERLARELERGARLEKVNPTTAETDAERIEQLEQQVAELPADERERLEQKLHRGPGRRRW